MFLRLNVCVDVDVCAFALVCEHVCDSEAALLGREIVFARH